MTRSHFQRSEASTALFAVLLFVVLVAVFLAAPFSGDDWETFHGASWRVLHGESLYGSKITHAYYSNPPWLAVLLIPLAILPEKLGWAIICASTLFAALLLLRRWNPQSGVIKPVLILLSPPMIYTLLHGEIDLLIISGVFLPVEWWALVALTKPQVAIGMVFGVPPKRWQRAAMILGIVVIVSLLWFGLWVRDLADQDTPFVSAGHNLWKGLWPFQVPLGVLLIVLGIARKEEQLLVAGSPFVSPYAALSSMLGPWLAAITYLNNWQALAVFASWWGAVIYRGVVG